MDRLELFAPERPHSGQIEAWRARDSLWRPGGVAFFACGPRWGKDRLSTWLNLFGLLRTLQSRREAGSSLIPLVYSWVVAPTSEDYEQVWREYVTHTAGLRRSVNRARGQERIILEADPGNPEGTGIWIDFKSGWSPDRLVGSGIDSLHITEGAKLSTDARDQLLARLASPGRVGVQIINGTPTEAPSRWYIEEFKRRREMGGPLFVNAPSWENPTLGDDGLEALLAIRGSVSARRWDANWGARLVPQGSGLFAGLREASTAQPQEPVQGGRYVKFYDLAGRGADFSVVSVWRTDGGFRHRPQQVHLERWADSSWRRAEERIRNVARRYRGEFHFDATARLVAEDRIRAALPPRELVEPVTFTPKLKAEMVDHAVHMIETGKAVLLHPEASDAASVQFEEMTEFQETRSAAGNVRHHAPEGGHDDTVTGVLGGLWAVREMGAPAHAAFQRVTGGTPW